MNSAQLLLLVVFTALASSLMTLMLGWWVFQRWIRPRLEAQMETFAAAVEARARREVEAVASELLPRVRAELTAGFQEAVADNLPAFREEVRKGFVDALTALDAGDLLDRTARKVVRTGSSLVETGLSLLRPSRPDDQDPPPR